MADTLEPKKTDSMPFQSQEEILHFEDDMKNESGEEYSSGSDRSLEADNLDDSRCDLSSGGTNEAPLLPARIRSKKRRHGSHGSRRQKGGSRHKHRPFQPYPEKGDIENTLKRKSLELQEKENAAALLRQEGGEDQFITFPVAPFNSTQFLMDEHSLNSPNSVSKAVNSPKFCAQDVTLSSLTSTPRNDADDMETLINNRKDKEFSDIYSSIHAENLQSMPKEELVKHYMSLEEQVALLQKKVAAAEQRSVNSESDCGKGREIDQDNDKDWVPGSDNNSLSSGNEEFVDLASMNGSNIDKDSSSYDVVQKAKA